MANAEVGSAYVTIYPQTDGNFSKQVGKQMDGASSAVSAKAVAIGNVLSNALLGAVTKAADAVGAVIGGAFENSAEFEQLYGGVQKIFDQANVEGILQDANDAYKNLNMSANEYLSAVNQTGATFAQTMGDQKGYDTAKTGMQAIADYASGTGRSVDELTEKFSMITRATSSYQSIADQFSGILPATSADFLEQAQAAGFLSGEYKKLTEVPVAEYQEAVTRMLEKGVTDMGLAGNTAAESAGTLSGSLAMMKSAWENFLTSLGSDEMSTQQATKNLVDSFVTAAQNIIPRVVQIIASLGEALPQIAEQISPYIDQLVNAVSSFIEQHRTEIEAAAKAAFDGVKTAISFAVSAAIQALGEALGTLVATLPEWGPQVLAAAGTFGLSILEGIVHGLDPLMDDLETVVTDALKVFTDAISDFFNAAADLGTSVIDGIGSTLSDVGDTVVGFFTGIPGAVAGVFSQLVSNASQIPGRVLGFFSNIGGRIANFFSSLPGQVAGFFNNMVSNISSIPSRIVGFFSGIGGRITDAIGSIHFPQPDVRWETLEIGPAKVPIPHVTWHAAGGIVDGAQLIGVGERGAELIWPSYDPYLSRYAEAIADAMPATGGITINLNYDAGADANEMLVDISRGIRQLRMAGAI